MAMERVEFLLHMMDNRNDYFFFFFLVLAYFVV